MFVKRIRVRNFRSIRDCSVELGEHTAILGGNGAGKSTILRAMEKFYSSSSQIELDDFFGRQTAEPIEITLTFSGFSDEEREMFSSKIHADEMPVTRVFEATGGRSNGKYYGLSMQHGAFIGIRNTAGAREKTQAYNSLREQGGRYGELTPVRRAEEVEEQLAQWEQNHPDECELFRDEGQFFGFTNVARGSLQKYTSFVFIPAVREVSADAVDAKGAVVARLMELVVRSAIQRRADIVRFQSEVGAQYRELVSPERLTELGTLSGALTETLQRFYMEAAVNLKWREVGDFSVPLPSADVFLDDDGFEGPVDRKGHGLQRAFVLTLLQHLARASAASVEEAEAAQVIVVDGEDAEGAAATPIEQDRADLPPFVLPGLILAIEEPELYQHPTKQRHFAKVLRQLSEGSVPGVAAQTQILFASHSSLFVSVGNFDEVRLARRRPAPGIEHKECVLTSSSLEAVCRRLERAFVEVEGTRRPEALRGRLHVIGPELSEGFFADVVVLVEGPSDRAALVAAAQMAGYDLEANGIAVLPVTGKTGLASPACIFQELGIPTYLVWESDNGRDGPINQALQRISGVADEALAGAATSVTPRYATFTVDLEATIKSEIAPDLYDRLLDTTRDAYGLQQRADAAKSPIAMTEVLTLAKEAGQESRTLTQIVGHIQALRESLRRAPEGI